jgi:hypothetical protein
MTIQTINDVSGIDELAVAALARSMRGSLLTPDAHDYDAARHLVNARFDQRPSLIARCHNAQDVALAVRFAREYELPIAVRSGGHGAVGYATGDGVMVIDLSQMKRIAINPIMQMACVQPGATNGDLVLAAAAYNLATTTGTCATVGMGGSTLGGGIGWLMGRFGMTIDNVLEVELVTAEGEIVQASASKRPDLFWALRGGGGNFGVVTDITYQLHQLGPVLGGVAIFPLAAAADALQRYFETTSSAPDELLAHALLATVPEFGPALIVQAVYSGKDLSEGERVLAPLREGAAIDAIAPRSYAETYMMLTPPLPPVVAYHETAYTLRQPNADACAVLLECAADSPSPLALINIHCVHGAATRVAPDATAFALREKHYAVANIAMWMEGTGEAEGAWAHATHAHMAPFASRGLYVNFLGDEGEGAIRDSYRANYARLAAVKAAYDPD